jgi:peptide/nickel transport system ATP-binding protein
MRSSLTTQSRPASITRPEPPLLELRDLKTYFYTEDGIVQAVDGVSITVRRGETLGIVGESGSGKSVTSLSILRLIAAPGKIVGGSVIFDGIDLASLAEDDMRQIRGNRIAMIFQQPTTCLNPVFRVGDQIVEALQTHLALKPAEAHARCIELLGMVGLPDPKRRFSQYPHELSGGQCQRVMIAMALACNPELLIADEPTTALDVTIQAQILDLMRAMRTSIGTSIILITHDMGVVAEMCDNVTVMYAGQVVEHGPVQGIFDDPKHPYTQGLLASMPVLGEKRDELTVIPGTVPGLIDPPTGCRFKNRCPYRFERCDTMPPLISLKGERQARCWLHEHGEVSLDTGRWVQVTRAIEADGTGTADAPGDQPLPATAAATDGPAAANQKGRR